MNFESIPVVIFAGGFGSRLSEKTESVPKPLIPIGRQPIIEHIIRIYEHFGCNEFFVLGGYRISDMFAYFDSDCRFGERAVFDYATGTMSHSRHARSKRRVHVIDTGLTSQTGSRLSQIRDFLETRDCFFLTYGDGLGNINLSELMQVHRTTKPVVTMSAVMPDARFGGLTLLESRVVEFREKSKVDTARVNGGFFVCDSSIFEYVSDKEDCVFEVDVLRPLAEKGLLRAHIHDGFWHPMDTKRDLDYLCSCLPKLPWLDFSLGERD